MKFSLSSLFFTALLVPSTEVIPGVAGDQAAPTFPPTTLNAGEHEYGIEVVVNGTSGSADDTATDMIEGVDPFTVTSFFEVSNKYTDIDGADNNIATAITVEVYTTVIGDSEDDCSKGTLIETDQCGTGDCFTISAGAVNRNTAIVYPLPRKADGIVGATTVELSNFMSNAIYRANEDPAETGGTVEFCVRTSTKLGDETVSHIDSKKKILVDLAGNFASLQLVDNIVKADNKDFETTVVKEIPIDTFVCNIRNERVNAGRSYKIGEQFRICVGPQATALAEGYKVDNFVEVICGTNTATPRSLVIESNPTDSLTSIESLPLKNNRRAIRSVITTGYAVDGITTLSCTGKVSLSYTAPTLAPIPVPTTPTPAPGLGGSSSAACIALCDVDGNQRSPIPQGTTWQQFSAMCEDYTNTQPGGGGTSRTTYGEDINCWDISRITSLQAAFSYYPRTNTFNEALNCWDTAHITHMWDIFRFAVDFNQDVSMWNVGSVTSFVNTFTYARTFNQDINSWDTSSATDMYSMFWDAWAFNGAISTWNTASVTNMHRMFGWTHDFNQDINGWDISSVTEIREMFRGAKAFNRDITEWDTSSVNNMRVVFMGATAFNQDISTWDTSSVSNINGMAYMFSGATIFNQDISVWDTSNVVNTMNMFEGATAFNQNLCNWDMSNLLYSDDMFTRSGCDVKSGPTDSNMCKSCGEARRLGSSNNSNNNNKRSNKRRNLQEIVGDDDTSVVVAPFHMIATPVNTVDGPVRAVRNLQPLTGLDLSGGGGGEAVEEVLEGLFEVNIEMESPTTNESSSSAPCFSSSMTTTVAVIGCFGSLLSFVVSSMI